MLINMASGRPHVKRNVYLQAAITTIIFSFCIYN